MWPHGQYRVWPHVYVPPVARGSGCDDGHVDQLARAVQTLAAAQADVPRTEARARGLIANARAKVDKARAELAAVIVAEYQAGGRVSDLARRSGYTRETIRRILRAGGVEAD